MRTQRSGRIAWAPRSEVEGPPARGAKLGALGLCLAVAGALLLFFLVLYPIGTFRLALGSDTPVYIWWARYAGAEGLGVLGAAGRPGIVGLMATLSRASGLPVAAVAEAIGAVLAATLGLAAGALVETALGRDRVRFTLAALLSAAFLSVLVAGYFSTLAFGALFLAALALLALTLRARGGWREVVAVALLLGAAGLAHPLFVPLALGVMAGGLVALAPAWRRDRALGLKWTGRGATRVAAAALGGLAVTVVGLPLVGVSAAVTLDTSRDAVLRRLGLGHLVTESFQRKLRNDFPWWRAVSVVGLALAPFAPTGWGGRGAPRRKDGDGPASRESSQDSGRLFWGLMLAWVALTVISVLALLAGVPAPGQRLAAFCLPLPLLASIGLRRLRTKLGPSRARTATVLMLSGAMIFMAVAWVTWADQYALVRPAAVAQSRIAGAALAAQPPGTPLVFIAEPRFEKPGLQAVRYTNYVRDAVPASRVPDVHIFLGTVADFRAGRPTHLGRLEHDRLSADSWAKVRPLLDRSPLVVVMNAFDSVGYRAALSLPEVQGDPGRHRIGRGVVAVPGYTGRTVGEAAAGQFPARLKEPGAGPLSPWMPLWVGPALVLLLGLLGAPWAFVLLPPTVPLARIALSPAFGVAALSLTSVVADAMGLRLSEGGGPVAASAAIALGIAAGIAARGASVPPEGRTPAAPVRPKAPNEAP
ncbi:hypothetical protein BH20ACT24_BH20ACT24_01750 [soil metagenome]